MKRIAAILFVMTLLISFSAQAETKIDPTFNFLKFTDEAVPDANIGAKFAAVKSVGNRRMVEIFIKAYDFETVEEEVLALGGEVKLKLQTVMTASVPLNAIEDLAKLDDVISIEASKKVRSKMNIARSDGITNVAGVQAGTGAGLSQAYNGSGVVIGVVDSGIDCSNADFQDAGGSSRIIAYKNMATGREYGASEIASGDCRDSDLHGTHVTGIAASRNTSYTGVAPKASIVGAQISGSEDQVIEGIEFIFNTAQNLRAPAVANLSLGNSIGPHDNTSSFETSINELLSGTEGRAIVCAAGNETVVPGDAEPPYKLGGLHGTVSVPGGAARGFETIIRSGAASAFGDSLLIDIWLSSGGDCTVELNVYTGGGATLISMLGQAPGDSNASSPKTSGNISAYVDFSDNINANNGKQHAQAVITYSSLAPNDPETLTYDLVFRSLGSSGCAGDAWIYPDFTTTNLFTGRTGLSGDGTFTYVSGDSDKMITIPGTSTGCLTVASYSSRATWTDKGGLVHDQESYDPNIGALSTPALDVSTFSSHGPGAGTSNTQKPDIAAPGEPIISTLNSDYNKSSQITSYFGTAQALFRVADDSYRHIKLEGSSMASPFMAGVVALLFEKNGCLTNSEIKSIITSNILTGDPNYPASLPDYMWGYGKVNALAAINAVTASDCEPDNPSEGTGKTCSLSRGASPDPWGMVFVLLGLVIVGLMRVARRTFRGR